MSGSAITTWDQLVTPAHPPAREHRLANLHGVPIAREQVERTLRRSISESEWDTLVAQAEERSAKSRLRAFAETKPAKADAKAKAFVEAKPASADAKAKAFAQP